MVLSKCRKAALILSSIVSVFLCPAIAAAATAAATVGQQVTFSVTAQGSAPFAYQWTKNGSAISGATAANYTITSVTTASAGTYAVAVSNSAGSITAPGATLTVNSALVSPAITAQPASVSVTAGQGASFSVTATGSAPLTYAWRKNGIAISGATGATYAIASTSTGNAGTYSVVVTNGAGTVTSVGATLTVAASLIAPAITTQPLSLSVTAGQPASFSVLATGSAPLTYQWKKNSTAISGATSATYSLAATATGDAGTYTVVVTNGAGSATSTGATLTVATVAVAPTITQQPASLTVVSGKAATFTVAAIGTAPMTYTWRKNGAAIAGATSASYSIATTTSASAGTYSVVVKNAAGTVTSANAVLSITTANANGLVAAYSFDEASGTTVKDLSGNGNTGTLVNASWTTSGKYRGALSFNGTSSMVKVNDSASLDLTTGMTLEAWVCPSSVSGGRDVIYKSSNIYYLVGSSTTQNRPSAGGSYATSAVTGSYAISRNVWTHLAATFDGATMRLYANGKLVGSRAQTGTIRTSSGALTIGGDTVVGRFFAGRIDDIRIYNRALTQTELQGDMAVSVATAASTTTAQTLAVQSTTPASTTTDTTTTVVDPTTVADTTTTVPALPGRLDGITSRVALPAGSSSARTTFVIGGTVPQTVLIRGCGPALSAFGISNAISSPMIKLSSGSTEIASNSSWTWTDPAAIRAATIEAGTFALSENNSDAALVSTLAPGSYTVQLSDDAQLGGVGLIEVYALGGGTAEVGTPATSAVVGQGATVLVSGLVIDGEAPVQLLLRAVGPSLSSSQTLLARPVLKLTSAAGTVIAQNQGWSSATNATAIVTQSALVGASALPAGSGDSAALVTATPGTYTVEVSSADATSGLVQLEVFVTPAP